MLNYFNFSILQYFNPLLGVQEFPLLSSPSEGLGVLPSQNSPLIQLSPPSEGQGEAYLSIHAKV